MTGYKIKKRRSFKKRFHCLVMGHRWVYVGRTKDWLKGGIYYWYCAHCETKRESSPYKGGRK